MWQRAFAVLLIGLAVAVPAAGCARPQRRPEAQGSPAQLNAEVARVAARESGAGETAAVVFDNRALIAIQLDAAQPGGTSGQGLTGPSSQRPDGSLTDPGKGPPAGAGPGGSTGVTPAMPGGGTSPGGSTPGGSPVHTQAVPNHAGGPANDSGTTGPAGSTGSLGNAPLDVMHRIANQVKARFPAIEEVRFAHRPEDARRVQAMAQAIQGGARADGFRQEWTHLYGRGAPAGVTEFDPMHPAPANNPKGAPGPAPRTR